MRNKGEEHQRLWPASGPLAISNNGTTFPYLLALTDVRVGGKGKTTNLCELYFFGLLAKKECVRKSSVSFGFVDQTSRSPMVGLRYVLTNTEIKIKIVDY